MTPPEQAVGERRTWLLSLFLVSGASLSLEILQMRIFAYVFWHHLAFLIISIAILGFASAGAFLAASERLQRADLGNSVAVAGLLFAVSCLIGPFLLVASPVDIFGQISPGDFTRIGLYYLIFALPYFFAGYIVSIVLMRRKNEVGKLYFVNLVGSGIGCFLIFATLMALAAEGTLILIAALGAISALVAANSKGLRAVSGIATVALLVAVPFSSKLFVFQPADSKLLTQVVAEPDVEVVYSKWTPLCQISVTERTSPTNVSRAVYQDGDARTGIPAAGGEGVAFPPYTLKKDPRVLIIGTGGGWDVHMALSGGASHITGAEINPVTLGVCKNPEYNVLADSFNANPNIELNNAEGRFFVRSNDTKYDIIQMSGVDTYTALSSGAYVLSESYLYTKDAFEDYFDHLTDDGIVSITRFTFPVPRECLRVMVMACEVLAERGAEKPWEHLAVLRLGSVAFPTQTSFAAIYTKKTPFTKEELDTLRSAANNLGAWKDYLPDETGILNEKELAQLRHLVETDKSFEHYPIDPDGVTPYHAYARALKEGTADQFIADYPYDLRPVTDDAPYFFNQHRISSLWNWILGKERAETEDKVVWMAESDRFMSLPLGMIMLFLTVLQLAVLVALCIFAPILIFRRRGIRGYGFPTTMGYFLCLGFAYIFLMMASMQRFGLVLGHPTFSVTVTMATFLIASGLGSLVSSRFRTESAGKVIGVVAVALLLLIAAQQFVVPAWTKAVLGESFAVRVAYTIAVISPLAFVMGMCFPMGVRVLGEKKEELIPWAYGVNGSATVLGSVVAVCLAIWLGFAWVQWFAWVGYAGAAVLMRRLARPA